ncbi:MAG: M24 family metallopeptidase [Thermomicrobiales bacterium]
MVIGQAATGTDAWIGAGTREDRIAEGITRAGLDALVATTSENAEYLSGRPSTIATLWPLPGLVAVAVNAQGDMAVAAGDQEIAGYQRAAERFPYHLWIEHLDLRGGGSESLSQRVTAARPTGPIDRPAQYETEQLLDAVAAAIAAASGGRGRIGLELHSLPAWILEGVRQRLPAAEFVDATAVMEDLRVIKDPQEQANLRLAGLLTDIGIAGARDSLQPGRSAIDVSAAYQTAIWQAVTGDSRYTALRQAEGLVSVGDGGGPVAVGPGQTIKLDMQVDVGGYHSDIGRTYCLQPFAEQQAVYDALYHALEAAIAAAVPGEPISDIWQAGTRAMRASGFANYSRGHLGHSVGLAHHYEEAPFVSATEHRPLAPGMVVSIELPYYLLGVGSYQMERMVIVGESSVEVVDDLPFILDPIAAT